MIIGMKSVVRLEAREGMSERLTDSSDYLLW
jgi:hypothetical protein